MTSQYEILGAIPNLVPQADLRAVDMDAAIGDMRGPGLSEIVSARNTRIMSGALVTAVLASSAPNPTSYIDRNLVEQAQAHEIVDEESVKPSTVLMTGRVSMSTLMAADHSTFKLSAELTPTPTPEPTPTAEPTPSPTATPTATPSPTPTATPETNPTATPEPTAAPPPEATPLPVATATATPQATVTVRRSAEEVTASTSQVDAYTSAVNTADPLYPRAKAEYERDPMREPWAGDDHELDMFQACPDQVNQHFPKAPFRYDPKKGQVKFSYTAGGDTQYCNTEMGKFRERISLLVRRGQGKFKQVGKTVIHTVGLREELARFYGMSKKYTKVNKVITGVGNVCKKVRGRTPKVQMRLRFKDSYIPDPKQDFQHRGAIISAVSDNMEGASATYSLPVKTVCKK